MINFSEFPGNEDCFSITKPAVIVSTSAGIGLYLTMQKAMKVALEATRRVVLNVEAFNQGAKMASEVLNRWYITNTPITDLAEFSSLIKLCVDKLDQSLVDVASKLPLSLSVSCAYETFKSFSRELSGESKTRFFVVDLMEGFLQGSLLGLITAVSAATIGSSSKALASLTGVSVGAVAGVSGVFIGKTLGSLAVVMKTRVHKIGDCYLS